MQLTSSGMSAIMKDIIKRVFGTEEFKLSQAVPSQSPLVEYFIDEVKQLM